MTHQNSNSSFAGVWTAIATPFTIEGQIDWSAYSALVEQQIEGGVRGIVVCGTTGETPTLEDSEKLALIRRTRELCPKEVLIMAGTGGNNTAASVRLSVEALEAGAGSLLIVTPPYSKPNATGLLLHFDSISSATSAPICLYHVPGRTAQRLSPESIAEICKISNVLMVKEASGDLGLFSRAKILSDAEFLSGDDPTYLASLSLGGHGCISVLTNLYPKEVVAMTNAYGKGDTHLALRLHETLLPIIDALSCETNPCPLKAALTIRSTCKNILRAPLAPVCAENYQNIKDILSQTDRALAEIA